MSDSVPNLPTPLHNDTICQAHEPSWSATDDQRVSQRISNSRNLTKFWKMMLDIFKRGPYDLFTWGIRIDQGDEDGIIDELCDILPHEAFKADLAILQYVLQIAVASRVENHVPPPSSEPVARFDEMGERVEGASPNSGHSPEQTATGASLATAQKLEEEAGPIIAELRGRLQGRTEARPTGETVFFVLQRQDIQIIKDCLDHLHTQGSYRLSVQDTNAVYMLLNLCHWEEMQPSRIEGLELFEKASMLARRAARDLDLPNWPKGYLDARCWRNPKSDARLHQTMFMYDDSWYAVL
ncbi:hypothetical protein GGR52DRAFT_576548 [Hypoxylon sp. FL1284]|nr:hypothetical protein GGR52DRAFT_576548 [Hypoxylon sp. FL1284]